MSSNRLNFSTRLLFRKLIVGRVTQQKKHSFAQLLTPFRLKQRMWCCQIMEVKCGVYNHCRVKLAGSYLQDLCCCLVKHFNISGCEVAGSTYIVIAVRTKPRISSGWSEWAILCGEGFSVACSVVVYVQVLPVTKRWSEAGTCEYSVTVTTWLDVQLNRSVAIDVI